jgi:RND superfamily putative drug exporter
MVTGVSSAQRDASGRWLRIEVSSRPDPASPQAQSFANRLRDKLIPAAHFPGSALVLAGGGAAYAADFVSRTLGPFPWLVLGVLGLTYLVLVRAFRSLLLPLKAITLNFLTVAAATGLMIAVFEWGWGSWAGLLPVEQIEGWIPVFMFTLLFGLSMDYEVFLVSRMREAWEVTRSNHRAVTHGLASTGRVVTAAGLIMASTFSGLMFGSIPTMQQLGFGLAIAILIDITLVRGLLLPSTMALAGRWNWYLPRWAARAFMIRG